MKKENLIYSTLILTAASIFTRILGMVFRVYLSNQIGAVGMGVYQMILSVYTFTATFACSGIVVAVSSLVAAHLAKQERSDARHVLQFCLALSGILGIAAGIVLFFGAEAISTLLLKEPAAAFSLKLLAPGLVFMSLSSCFRGYFLAISKVSKPAIAMIIEQLTRMAVITAFMNLWLPLGLKFSCAAAVIGMTVGEILSALYLNFVHLRNRTVLQGEDSHTHSKRSLCKNVLKLSIPVAISSYLQSTLRLIENMILPNGLKQYAGGENGLGIYGSLKGMAMPLLMFPSVFLSSLSVSLVPEIARAVSINNQKRVSITLNRVIKITLVTSILIVAIFLSFSQEIGQTLYHSDEVGRMLAILAPLCPFIYLEIVASGILRGLNEQLSSLRYNTVDSILRIVLILLIVPNKGLYGFIVIMYLSNIYTAMSSVLRLLKVTTLTFDLMDWLCKPILGAIGATLLCKGICLLLPSGTNSWLSLGVSVLLITVCYLLLLILLRCITKSELQWIGKKLRLPAKRQDKAVTVSSFLL